MHPSPRGWSLTPTTQRDRGRASPRGGSSSPSPTRQPRREDRDPLPSNSPPLGPGQRHRQRPRHTPPPPPSLGRETDGGPGLAGDPTAFLFLIYRPPTWRWGAGTLPLPPPSPEERQPALSQQGKGLPTLQRGGRACTAPWRSNRRPHPPPSRERRPPHPSRSSPPEAGPKPGRTTAPHSAPCAILSPPPRPPPPAAVGPAQGGGQTGSDWQEATPPLVGLCPAQAPQPRPPYRLACLLAPPLSRLIDPLDSQLLRTLLATFRRRVQAEQAERRVQLMQPNSARVTVPGTRRRRRPRKRRGAGLSAGDRGGGAMGDAPSPEEKLHLITRNLQVGPQGWNYAVGGDWGLEVQ